MATDATKVKVGAATVKVGEYVSAAGAATLVDVGHIDEAPTLGSNFESFDVESERTDGVIKTTPTKSGYEVEVSQIETTIARMAQAFRQAAAQVTGGAPNQTLKVITAVNRFFQITVEVPGDGTNSLQTLTFWKCQPISVEPITFGKAATQKYKVKFRVLYDDSISPGEYWRRVDS
jgi:hypothetical protein